MLTLVFQCSLQVPKDLFIKYKTTFVSGRIEYLDSLNWDDLQVELAIGMLAGNVFDWGAKEVALLMEESSLVILISYLDQTEIMEFNRMTLSV